MSPIQGVYGIAAKILGLSSITHVGPIYRIGDTDYTVTLTGAQKIGGTIRSGAAVNSLESLERLGVKLIDKIYIGQHQPLSVASKVVRGYADSTGWDLLFWSVIGRFIGLTRPRQCVTLVSHMFGVKESWHPASLYRRLKNEDYCDCRQGEGGKDNPCKSIG